MICAGSLVLDIASWVTHQRKHYKLRIAFVLLSCALTYVLPGKPMSDLPLDLRSTLPPPAFTSRPSGFAPDTNFTSCLPKTPSAPGYRASQLNCRPVTRTTTELASAGNCSTLLAHSGTAKPMSNTASVTATPTST